MKNSSNSDEFTFADVLIDTASFVVSLFGAFLIATLLIIFYSILTESIIELMHVAANYPDASFMLFTWGIIFATLSIAIFQFLKNKIKPIIKW